jgi:tripartite-type tricarboxylate transporter receptor subunit TctC
MQRYLLAALISIAVPAITTAPAAEWPARPIKIIAPSTPGGAADTFARLLAEVLPPQLHQPVVVDNRAGGGGMIGAAATAHAEPDGYTLVTSSVGYLVVAPAMSPNPGFDAIRDFTHIAYLGGPPNAFVVHPALGVHSLKELIALARGGRSLDFVSPGVGSVGHLVLEYFAQRAGLKVQHIPHKGSSQAMMDLIAGNVMIGSMTWSSAVGQIRAGTMIPLAVSSSARVAEFPAVPTLREEGFDDLVVYTWYALSGPAGLSDDVVAKLNRAVNAGWATPSVQRRLAEDAIAAEPMTPQAVTAYMASEVRKWGPIAKRVVAGP